VYLCVTIVEWMVPVPSWKKNLGKLQCPPTANYDPIQSINSIETKKLLIDYSCPGLPV
jgi:hypothetical protein